MQLHLIVSLALLSRCMPAAAQPAVLGQPFETEVLQITTGGCQVRVRLPEPYSYGAWIDVRNEAIRAATRAASACCSNPQVQKISDWMAGFAAYAVDFRCAPNEK